MGHSRIRVRSGSKTFKTTLLPLHLIPGCKVIRWSPVALLNPKRGNTCSDSTNQRKKGSFLLGIPMRHYPCSAKSILTRDPVYHGGSKGPKSRGVEPLVSPHCWGKNMEAIALRLEAIAIRFHYPCSAKNTWQYGAVDCPDSMGGSRCRALERPPPRRRLLLLILELLEEMLLAT